MSELALFPGSPGTKNRKERREPGKHKKCHRENLSTCGRTNELPHTLFHRLCLFSYESFTADRMGLEGTTLHLLAVGKDMVSIHRPVNSKSMLALQYSLT